MDPAGAEPVLGVDALPGLAALVAEAFPGARALGLAALAGQASSRRYYRLRLEGAAWDGGGPGPADVRSSVVMRLPDDPALAFGSDEGQVPEEVDGNGAPRLPFLDVQRFLAARGLPVPAVYAVALERRLLLLEDLGDVSFEARLRDTPGERWESLYGAAVDLLAELHGRTAQRPGEAPARVHRSVFGADLLRWELDHFREWGLEALLGPLDPVTRRALDGHFDALAATLARAPRGFVHRDYQSRNLHWRGPELVLLDFQDALQGPAVYDLVALLNDGYVQVPEALQLAMRRRYAAATGRPDDALFDLVAVHRKLKDAGRFVYIDRVRGDASFLPYVGRCLGYVDAALARWGGAAARELREIFARLPGYPDGVKVASQHR
ncbi:MAG: phosphotransferase [Myxococcota bacterium]